MKRFLSAIIVCIDLVFSLFTASADPVINSDTIQESDLSEHTVFTDPALLKFVDAPYPKELIKKGIEGTVLLDIHINADGTVDSVAVVGSAHPELDSLAVQAALQFKFTPATERGKRQQRWDLLSAPSVRD